MFNRIPKLATYHPVGVGGYNSHKPGGRFLEWDDDILKKTLAMSSDFQGRDSPYIPLAAEPQ